MPAIIPFDVADAATTPVGGTPGAVTYTFNPNGKANGLFSFTNGDVGTTGANQWEMRAGIDRHKPSRPTDHIHFQCHLPVEQTVDGIPETSHVNRAFTKFVFDPNATEDERRDLLTLHVALVSSYLNDMVTKLENGW